MEMESTVDSPYNLLCMGCLGLGRTLQSLKDEKLKQCYLDIIREISQYNTPIKFPRLCLVCNALLRKAVSFREQVQDSYRILQAYTSETLTEFHLSIVSRPPKLHIHNLELIDIAPTDSPSQDIEFEEVYVKEDFKYESEVPAVEVEVETTPLNPESEFTTTEDEDLHDTCMNDTESIADNVYVKERDDETELNDTPNSDWPSDTENDLENLVNIEQQRQLPLLIEMKMGRAPVKKENNIRNKASGSGMNASRQLRERNGEGRSENRDRSRSPIWLHQTSESAPTGVVVQMFDEDGTPLDADVPDMFITAGAHFLFESPEQKDLDDRILRERGRRGRSNRGVGRGRGARKRAQPVRRSKWEVGHPLTEIEITDMDIPGETGGNVTRNQEPRMQDRNEVERADGNESENEEDDEFFDANDDSRLFEWHSMESFQGQEETFKPKRTGSALIHESAYDAFRSYWDDDIMELIASETNAYASKIDSSVFQSEWVATNSDEILCLFAFWMMLGIIRMPSLNSCFSTDPLLKTEVFKSIFTRQRYEHLCRALHFIEVGPASDATSSSDRLNRLRPIISHLNSTFQSNYILDKDICIDESLTLWKGRSNIKQYIRTKASKVGIKTFELCESTTGYLWSFIVYTGRHASADLEQAHGALKSTTVVKTLMAPLLNKGHRLFMDNWYNSPMLARFLKRNGTDCVGTLRPSRRDIPDVINKAPLNRGQIIARHSGDVALLSWRDKKRVTMISTCHGSSIALPRVASKPMARPVPWKPQVVLDYNKFMGGVDLKDQMLAPYLIERKRCNKWYMKLFKRLLNVSILNSRILLQSSTKKSQDHLGFRVQLVHAILKNHLPHCPQTRRFAASSAKAQREGISRLIGAHWPALLDQTGATTAENRSLRKRCVVCLRQGRKSSKTIFWCENCKVPLCIKSSNCFKIYHTSSK